MITSSNMSHDPITKYGLTAVPAAAGAAIDASPAPSTGPSVIPVSETAMPTTALARRTHAYAQKYLPVPTYNHSMRVYHYGLAMKQYRFANAPEWAFTDETYFLASLLHDIGLTGENLRATKLSFEFYGGYLALDVLRQRNGDGDDNAEAETKVEAVAPRDQAESIAEAIIRHQDLCDEGTITALGQLLQMATLFGNLRLRFRLVDLRLDLGYGSNARAQITSAPTKSSSIQTPSPTSGSISRA